jgi:hypothetical protein
MANWVCECCGRKVIEGTPDLCMNCEEGLGWQATINRTEERMGLKGRCAFTPAQQGTATDQNSVRNVA